MSAPEGEVIGIDDIIFMAAMIYFNGVQTNFMYAAKNINPGNWNWKNPWTYINMAAAGFSAYTQVKELSNLSNTDISLNLFDEKPEFWASLGDPPLAPVNSPLSEVLVTANSWDPPSIYVDNGSKIWMSQFQQGANCS